jgi:hypothetical protein
MSPFNRVAVFTLLLAACGSGRQFGTVELGSLSVEGEVQQEFLSQQLLQLDPTFEACYVRALRANRSAEGVIAMNISGKNGHVIPEITANETGSDDLGECVESAVAQLPIREPAGYDPWDFVGQWSVRFDIIRSGQ